MKLIVGLGNPGNTYQLTRHNLGRMAVESMAGAWSFGEWRSEKKFAGLLNRGRSVDEEFLLLLPETFMNLSGESVAKVVNFYRLDPERDLLVVYDDLDLSLGAVKLTDSGPRAHNGVMNIQEKLAGAKFAHLRLGIENRGVEKIPAGKDYVLGKFFPDELMMIKQEIMESAGKMAILWARTQRKM